MRCNRSLWSLSGVVVMTLTGWLTLGANSASAIEGTELNSSVGLWAPLLPDLANDSGDSVGTVLGLSGHHRFDGYRTSIESGVTYGISDSAEMVGVDVLLRDTWDFGKHHLSAGFGYSMMDWDQDTAGHDIESNYQGAKVVTGWETCFGRTPVWLDLTLGLYDLDGAYVGDDGAGGFNTGTTGGFTTTYGFDIKTEFDCCGIPARAIFGLNYFDDFAVWRAGQVDTEDAVVLNGSIEFRLY
ncbi:hypothetical protein [Rhodopirellula sp. SWK7]|uniref:hypothetical protein n=1 Tax=Rhodopirellula sp. SWK7 TaxID=595460 RepID=UPI0003457848|nr:hypothetical protein [Rhodopirellula sp. SWK7]